VNAKIQRRLRAAKRRIEQRLDKTKLGDCSRPVLTGFNIHFELAERTRGMSYGGLGAVVLLVRQLGLAEAIDRRLALLKIHLPYHESDHVLNLAYNALCDGTCLDDIELRRNDEVFLDALGARRIPDPTTAGDFCRRFEAHHLDVLQDVFDEARRQVWAQQPASFLAQATIDMDGTLVPTTGACKQGMDISYNGVWGFHPLVVSLAETGEVLRIVNRSGNRPSHEGPPPRRTAPLSCAWRLASSECCCAATPTSRRPGTWTAGAMTSGCGFSSASTPRATCSRGPTICRKTPGNR
jgi:hypothetical protein